jgi:hypothetical protein
VVGRDSFVVAVVVISDSSGNINYIIMAATPKITFYGYFCW